MSTAATRRQRRTATKKLFPLDRLDYNTVKWVGVESIRPSPENDAIYGATMKDAAFDALIESIEKDNLGDPILITEDGFILSGHRRYLVLRYYLKWEEIPVRVMPGKRREGNDQYHRDLAAFNPQRVKSVAAMFRESLLLDNTPADTYKAIAERADESLRVEVEFMEVARRKIVRPVSPKQREFLECVQRGIDEMRDIHPLTIRKIHYWIVSLLRKPLMLVCKKSSEQERYRYRNDLSSYKTLGRLLTAARYSGDIPMNVIDDPTRPEVSFDGFTDAAEYIAQENAQYMRGFHLDRQQGQERFLYVLPEKNTIIPEVKRACAPYYVPFCPARGFAGPSVWHRIAKKFEQSGKKRMTLLCISDYDPEGLELPDDALRSLGVLRAAGEGATFAARGSQFSGCAMSRGMERRAAWG